MLIDLDKITDFRISKKKDVEFDINGKTVIFEIPYIVSVNPEKQCLYIGELFETKVDLVDEDIKAILSGDESLIESTCADFVFRQITQSRFCKK